MGSSVYNDVWRTSSDCAERPCCWWHSVTSQSSLSIHSIPRRYQLVDLCPPLYWRRVEKKAPFINHALLPRPAAPGSPALQAIPSPCHQHMTENSRLGLLAEMTAAVPNGKPTTGGDFVPDDEVAKYIEGVRKAREPASIDDLDAVPHVAMGTRVDKEHSNYALAFCMLTGIRHSVSRVEAKLTRELTRADFAAKHKNAFDIAGHELTPSSQYDFKFKDYAPLVFKEIRKAFRVDPADYLLSLTAKYIVSELASSGKSGSFFYYSRDYKYIIKTIHHSEAKVLQKILPAYYEHVRTQPNTLVSQFYGLHRIKLPYGHKIHFVIMNNIFPLHREMHARYDLKGSEIGRETIKKGADVTLKDINWLKNKQHLRFGPHRNSQLIDQLKIDTEFLRKQNLMDYSLLVGVHDTHRGNNELYANNLKLFHPGGEEAELSKGRQLKPTSRKVTVEEVALRKRRLRTFIHTDRPVAIGDYINEVPIDESRKGFTFYGDEGGYQSTDPYNMPLPEVYYTGIIDCLTEWSTFKRIENKWKAFRADPLKISPIKPAAYAERFMGFLKSQTTRFDGTVRSHPSEAPYLKKYEEEKMRQPKMQ